MRIKRYWVYFKRGHSQFSVYVLSVANFMGLMFLVIDQLTGGRYFLLFVGVFGLSYPVLNSLLGRWDIKEGTHPVAQRLHIENNPFYQDFSSAFIKHCLGQDLLAIDLMEKWGDRD